MAEDSLLGGNVFQSLGEARSQDMRKERYERDRYYRRERNPSFGDMLKQGLMAETAKAFTAPIGKAIEGFVSEPFNEMRDNLIERESSRKGLIGQSRQLNKTISTVRTDVDSITTSAKGQGLDPIAYKIIAEREKLDAEFVKSFGEPWRSDPDDLESRIALYNTLEGNLSEMVTKDWNEKTQFLETYGDRRFKAAENVKSDLIKYNPNPKNIGSFLFRKGLSLFGKGKDSDEREIEAFRRAAPELYALISDDKLLKEYELERDAAILTSNSFSDTANKEELANLLKSKNSKAIKLKSRENVRKNFVDGLLGTDKNYATSILENYPELSKFIDLSKKEGTEDNKSTFDLQQDKYTFALKYMRNTGIPSLTRLEAHFSDGSAGIKSWNGAQDEKRIGAAPRPACCMDGV